MKDDLAREVRTLSQELESEMIRIRRHIHQNPELGFQERKTARLVADKLSRLGLDAHQKVGRTGVVGLLSGEGTGRTVGLRADMDALPIQEKSSSPYRSQVERAMHACGHDAHVACLLGAAEILTRLDVDIPGAVKFLFQPNEEDLPSGALAMIEAGVLEEPPVDFMIAMHVDPEIPAGRIGIRGGPFQAQARDFEIQIVGRSGHGAHPHKGIDAIVMAAHFIVQLQSIVSRRVDPLQPAVISVGAIRGGYADNIIADRVELKGTLRCLDEKLGGELAQAVEDVLQGVTRAAGGRGQIRWTQGCAALVNDPEVSEVVRKAAVQLFGAEMIVADVPQSTGGDDFAYFLQRVPGALFLVGTHDGTARTSYPLHHPQFDIDEGALKAGAATFALTALNLLFMN